MTDEDDEMRRIEFWRLADDRRKRLAATGEAVPWLEARRYIEKRAAGCDPARPKTRIYGYATRLEGAEFDDRMSKSDAGYVMSFGDNSRKSRPSRPNVGGATNEDHVTASVEVPIGEKLHRLSDLRGVADDSATDCLRQLRGSVVSYSQPEEDVWQSDVDRVLEAAQPLCGSLSDTLRWMLNERIPSLAGTPAELIEHGKADTVISYINRIREGGYA